MAAKNKRTKRIEAWVRRNAGKYECACGCGSDIEINKTHYRKGIPNFVKGHNLTSHNPKQGKVAPIEETTWDWLSKEDKDRRLSQLKPFPTGEDHPNWRGGETITESGYKLIRCNEHPYNNGGYVAEHRLLVEETIVNYENTPAFFIDSIEGVQYIKRDCVVHHRDENKLNNVVENLVLMKSQSTHLAWHMRKIEEQEKFNMFLADIYCPWIKQ